MTASKQPKKPTLAEKAKGNPLVTSAGAAGHHAAKDIAEASTVPGAITTTETKARTGHIENKGAAGGVPSSYYAVPSAKAYGESTPEEHGKSGYRLPASFYDGESTELAQHKAPGNGHGTSEA